jgi:OPA family glycerol-3-phosphate transporter-like MFS transporter
MRQSLTAVLPYPPSAALSVSPSRDTSHIMSEKPPRNEPSKRSLSRWRKAILGLLWATYAAFYLCRVNLAAAQGRLSADVGLSKQQLGVLLALLKSFYATGQLVNGMLADRLGPRRLIVLGLGVSALLNLAFAHTSRFPMMAVVWALNGYFQAFGWTSTVRTIANWFPPRLRDAASGVIGTSYILGAGCSWILAGQLTDALGWRYAFWVPAWVCLGVCAVFHTFVRERPADVGLDDPEQIGGTPNGSKGCAWRDVLGTPALWALALANTAFMFGHHGLLDWTPQYLLEMRGSSAGTAALEAFLLPLGGAVGCSALAWIGRRRKRSLGAAAIWAPLAAAAALCLAVPKLVRSGRWVAPGLLLAIGALTAAPATLIACSMPANLTSPEIAGGAAGLVDAMGYVGSASSGWLSGHVMDAVGAQQGAEAAWQLVWRIWPLGLLIAAGMVAALGRRKRTEGKTDEAQVQ